MRCISMDLASILQSCAQVEFAELQISIEPLRRMRRATPCLLLHRENTVKNIGLQNMGG